MNYIEQEKARLAEQEKDDLVDEIINTRINRLVSGYSDYENGTPDPHGHGKRVPYIGWYWRTVDFANGRYVVGHCGEFLGFMENNKWGYPQRSLIPKEAEKVTEIICAAVASDETSGIVADIVAATQAKLAELWPLLQSFPIEVEGFWIIGPQGRVGFAETEDDADRMVAALTNAAPALEYRKLAA